MMEPSGAVKESFTNQLKKLSIFSHQWFEVSYHRHHYHYHPSFKIVLTNKRTGELWLFLTTIVCHCVENWSNLLIFERDDKSGAL